MVVSTLRRLTLFVLSFGALPASAQITTLVINEIDAAQPDSDTAEFVELYNAGTESVDLSQVELRFYNSSGSRYELVEFSSETTVPAGGYFVVCGNGNTAAYCGPVSNGLTTGLRDGPGAVDLITAGGPRIDVVSYDGVVTGFSEGSVGAPDDPITTGNDDIGISRIPDGRDTDDNAADFEVTGITPGSANIPAISGPVTQTLNEGEAWYLLAAPVAGLTLDGDGSQSASTWLDPLWTQGFSNADAPSGPGTVFRYNESDLGTVQDGYFPPADAQSTVPSGVGYFIYVYADDDFDTPGTVDGGFPKTLDAEGTEPATPFTFPVTFNDGLETAGGEEASPDLDNDDDGEDDDGWNLNGNPFRSAIDWDNPGWTRTNLEPTVWVYDPTDGYVSYNATTMAGTLTGGEIGVFQGFWTHAINANPALEATVQVKVGGEPEFYGRRADPPTAISFRLDGVQDGIDRSAYATVAWTDGCKEDRDYLCDAVDLAPLGSNALSLYTLANAESGQAALDISGLPLGFGRVEVPLGAHAVGTAPDGDVSLSWPELRSVPPGWTLTLRDRETGTEIDLEVETTYTFSLGAVETAALPHLGSAPLATKADDDTRFTLIVTEGTPVATDDLEAETSVSTIYPNPAADGAALEVRLASAQEVRVEVYDVLGRRVSARDLEAASTTTVRIDTADLVPGVYVVRVSGDGFQESRPLTVVR